MYKCKKSENALFPGFFGGSGDLIRTDDTPGMNRML